MKYEIRDIDYWLTATAQSVKTRIDETAYVNQRDELTHRTPLIWASRHNTDPEVVTTLLANGADVNATDKDGYTALMWSCWENSNPHIIAILLGAGADINAQDDDGHTALMLACWNNKNPEIVATVMDHGADIDLVDKWGLSAWDYMKNNESLKFTNPHRTLRELQIAAGREL